jgi:hypothetical protein
LEATTSSDWLDFLDDPREQVLVGDVCELRDTARTSAGEWPCAR